MVKLGDRVKDKYGKTIVWVACKQCGQERWVIKTKMSRAGYTGLCAKCCAKCPPNKGKGKSSGRIKMPEGYILLRLSPDDSFFLSMASKGGYVLEHRLVMAKKLGRCLHPWEIVHHRDGVKDNNTEDNLFIASETGHNQITLAERGIAKLRRMIAERDKEIQSLRAQLAKVRPKL